MSMRAVTIAGFVTLGCLATVLWALGRTGLLGLVTLGDVADAVARSASVRLMLVGGWVWLGWHLLAR